MEGNTCGICRDESCDFETRCGHFFHEDCLRSWFGMGDRQKICPYCTTKISMSKMDEKISRIVSLSNKGAFKIEEDMVKSLLEGDLHDTEIPFEFIIEKMIAYGWSVDDSLDKENHRFIHFAAKSNRLDLVKFILLKGANVNISTKDKRTALHFAVRSENLEMVKCLVVNGVDVNFCAWCWDAPLVNAVDLLNYEIIKYLVENGADVNIIDSSYKTPLTTAIIKDCNLDLIEFFLENGAEDSTISCLCAAIKSKNISLVKYFLEKVVDVNLADPKSKKLALHHAAEY